MEMTRTSAFPLVKRGGRWWSAVVAGSTTELPPISRWSGGVEGIPGLAAEPHLPYARAGALLLGIEPDGFALYHPTVDYPHLLIIGEDCRAVLRTIQISLNATGGEAYGPGRDRQHPDTYGFVCTWGGRKLRVVHTTQRSMHDFLHIPAKITEQSQGVYTYQTPWRDAIFYAVRKERE